MGVSTIWGIHGVFTGYSRGIHMYLSYTEIGLLIK